MDIKIDTSIYLTVCAHIFHKIMLFVQLLVPNDACHLDLLDFKYILFSTVFLSHFFHLSIF